MNVINTWKPIIVQTKKEYEKKRKRNTALTMEKKNMKATGEPLNMQKLTNRERL